RGQQAETGRRPALVAARRRERGEQQLPLVGAHARAQVRRGVVHHGGRGRRRITLLVAHPPLLVHGSHLRHVSSYFALRALTGAPRVARSAGTALAAAATSTSRAAAPRCVAGSEGRTSNSSAESTRVTVKAPASPTPTPAPAMRRPSPVTRRSTWPGVAPR